MKQHRNTFMPLAFIDIQGKYEGSWITVTRESNRKHAQDNLAAYRDNEPETQFRAKNVYWSTIREWCRSRYNKHFKDVQKKYGDSTSRDVMRSIAAERALKDTCEQWEIAQQDPIYLDFDVKRDTFQVVIVQPYSVEQNLFSTIPPAYGISFRGKVQVTGAVFYNGHKDMPKFVERAVRLLNEEHVRMLMAGEESRRVAIKCPKFYSPINGKWNVRPDYVVTITRQGYSNYPGWDGN